MAKMIKISEYKSKAFKKAKSRDGLNHFVSGVTAKGVHFCSPNNLETFPSLWWGQDPEYIEVTFDDMPESFKKPKIKK